MSMAGLLKLIGAAVVAGVGYIAYDIYDCRAKEAQYKVEAVYDLRRGCLFKTPDGYSSVYYKTNPK